MAAPKDNANRKKTKGRSGQKTRMTRTEEEALRQFYENRKDDDALWSGPVAGMAAGNTTVFSLRFSSAELQEIRRYAAQRGLTASDFVRKAALNWIRIPQVNITLQPAPFLSVFAATSSPAPAMEISSTYVSMSPPTSGLVVADLGEQPLQH